MKLITLLAPSVVAMMWAGAASAQSCDRLQSFSYDGHDVVIESAQQVEASVLPPGPGGPGGPVAAHCRVEGVVDARTGVGGKTYGTRFALALPEDWNGRFLFQGGGGLNGSVGAPIGGGASGGNPALSRGFAVIATDSGHQGAGGFDGSFMEDQQAALDFQYASNAKMAPIAEAMIAEHYGRPADHSYYVGCSTGGREGMIMAQRYPLYFDGIVTGAPAMRTGHSNMSLAYINSAFSEFAPDGPASLLSDSDKTLVVDSMIAACDAGDGVADGMIFNTQSCGFAPRDLLCSGEKTDSCLSEGQVAALEKAFRGPVDSRGRQVYPAFPWDPGLNFSGPGLPGILQSGGSSPVQAQQTSGGFDVDAATAAVEADVFGRIGDSTSPMLSSFQAAGGKQIFYHGMADPWFSANETRRYYDSLADVNGGADAVRDFARLFLVPGMGHCGGGSATLDSFDMVTAIVDWVENGVAPERVVSTGNAFPGRSRPLCAYPQYAHYTGGDPESADSFECRAP
jgi:feruloyl esterase